MKKRKVKKPSPPAGKPPATAADQKGESQFDFGGLPERNLKKNLGCG